jgi:hypothetical protein
MKRLGTINKRIDIGCNEKDDLYIMSNSNCIAFTYDEMECLVSVLNMLHNLGIEGGIDFLNIHRVAMWEPAPPEAKVTI